MRAPLPDEIIEFRRRLGLTQKELSYKLGINTETLSKWERGELAPRTYLAPALIGVELKVLEQRRRIMRDPVRWPQGVKIA